MDEQCYTGQTGLSLEGRRPVWGVCGVYAEFGNGQPGLAEGEVLLFSSSET